jgi:hypothetical protein
MPSGNRPPVVMIFLSEPVGTDGEHAALGEVEDE